MGIFDFFKRKNGSQLSNRYGDYVPAGNLKDVATVHKPTSYKSIQKALKDPGKVLNLDLSSQEIEKLPGELELFPNLQYLNIRNNRLTEIPSAIGNMKNLISLDIAYNEHLATLPTELNNLTNLVEFSCSGTNLGAIPPFVFFSGNLRELAANEAMISEIPKEIGLLENLEKIWIGSNELEKFPPEFGMLKKLQVLSAEGNGIDQLPGEFGGLESLTHLTLSHNELTSLPAEIRHLKKLEQLDLYQNCLATLPPEFGQLENLTWVQLIENELTTLPDEIQLLKKLRYFTVQRNKIPESEQKRLQKLVPYIEIDFLAQFASCR